jgi:hypothetical protein
MLSVWDEWPGLRANLAPEALPEARVVSPTGSSQQQQQQQEEERQLALALERSMHES